MTRPVFCLLDHTGLIRFSGADTQSFLQNLLTCDVAALQIGRSTYGAHCTPKGRMLASFLLWRAGEHDFFMQLPASLREPIQKQLSRFILRSRVKATDASAEWTRIGVAGESAGVVAKEATGLAVPAATHAVSLSAEAMLLALPTDRYEIVAAAPRSAAVLDRLAAQAERRDAEYWDWLAIGAGVPVIQPETQDALVPQMANLDLIGGVSFEKGCYPGQEIVARMHYRGTLKQRMYRAHVPATGPIAPATRLYSPAFGEQACGTVIHAARSPQGGYELLAALQIAAAREGDVRLQAPDGPALTLLDLPYRLEH